MSERFLVVGLTSLLALFGSGSCTRPEPIEPASKAEPLNILLAIADDWGFPHASAYGDPVVQTPAFDRVGREGALFQHAFVSAPSCTPSRGAILTGQYHWRLGGAANLWSVFPDDYTTYPELLSRAGYRVGHTGKGWGPGRPQTEGRALAGEEFESFEAFLSSRDENRPFAFWLGTYDPHRPFERGSGEESGINLQDIELPAHFPDHPEVRGDIADYYVEVQRFDALVGNALELLEERNLLETTLIVVTSDHGMPFPRCKSHLYDCGTRVPLAVRWPTAPNLSADAFVSLVDLAPTILDAAGLEPPSGTSGRSLRPLLHGVAPEERRFVVTGKERHVPSQEAPDYGGYPSRAIRTADSLYIRNFEPERWPSGTPNYEKAVIPGAWYADTDNGPTKSVLIELADDPESRHLYELSFAKRPAEELYDLTVDPGQLTNVAGDERYDAKRSELSAELDRLLSESGDPRVTQAPVTFDEFEYLGRGGPRFPGRQPDE